MNNNTPNKVLDLFAGIGGIKIGFEECGFTTVFSNDMISLYEKKLASWSVASELLVNYENVFL